MGPERTPICMAVPPLIEAGGEQEAWGSPAHCGDQEAVSTMAWTPLLLVSSLSAQVGAGPGHQGSAPSLISPWGADSGTLLQLLPHLPCVCVCRFPLPACADSAGLPLCISGYISQTLLHPEQWVQCW